MAKEFIKWFSLKEKLDSQIKTPPFVHEGDLWWTGIGENVGSEICGKSRLFSRPVLIYKKLSTGFYFVIPTTTKEKHGTWYVNLSYKGIKMNICLHQARSIDYRRLFSKLGVITQVDFQRVKTAFIDLYTKNVPR